MSLFLSQRSGGATGDLNNLSQIGKNKIINVVLNEIIDPDTGKIKNEYLNNVNLPQVYFVDSPVDLNSISSPLEGAICYTTLTYQTFVYDDVNGWVEISILNINLNQLIDTEISPLPSASEVLKYSGGINRWVNSYINLNEIAGIHTTNNQENDVLTYVGGSYINQQLPTYSYSTNDLTDVVLSLPVENDMLIRNNQNEFINQQYSILNIGDIEYSTLEMNQALLWSISENKFQNQTLNLNRLSDVNSIGAITGEVLVYNENNNRYENNYLLLNQIFDIVLDNPTSGDILEFNSGTSKFENVKQQIENHGNVVISNPLEFDVLIKNDSNQYVNKPILTTNQTIQDIKTTNAANFEVLQYNSNLSLYENKLLLPEPVNDNIIKCNNNEYQLINHTIEQINNVSISLPEKDHGLYYDENSSNWVNKKLQKEFLPVLLSRNLEKNDVDKILLVIDEQKIRLTIPFINEFKSGDEIVISANNSFCFVDVEQNISNSVLIYPDTFLLCSEYSLLKCIGIDIFTFHSGIVKPNLNILKKQLIVDNNDQIQNLKLNSKQYAHCTNDNRFVFLQYNTNTNQQKLITHRLEDDDVKLRDLGVYEICCGVCYSQSSNITRHYYVLYSIGSSLNALRSGSTNNPFISFNIYQLNPSVKLASNPIYNENDNRLLTAIIENTTNLFKICILQFNGTVSEYDSTLPYPNAIQMITGYSDNFGIVLIKDLNGTLHLVSSNTEYDFDNFNYDVYTNDDDELMFIQKNNHSKNTIEDKMYFIGRKTDQITIYGISNGRNGIFAFQTFNIFTSNVILNPGIQTNGYIYVVLNDDHNSNTVEFPVIVEFNLNNHAVRINYNNLNVIQDKYFGSICHGYSESSLYCVGGISNVNKSHIINKYAGIF
jgi:hypothetical protein